MSVVHAQYIQGKKQCKRMAYNIYILLHRYLLYFNLYYVYNFLGAIIARNSK